MAVLKSEIRNNFTTIPNSVIKAKDLTDAEYRLIIYLYSLPDGWKINQGYLGKELNCSRVNINKKLRKIKEAGYLEISKSLENDSDYIYILKDKGVSLDDVSFSDVSPSDVSLSDTHINTNNIKTNINKNNNIKENIKRNFIKPTIEDLEEYCNSASLSVDCQYFYDYYESNGWLVGKSKMKDWKATLRNWNRRNAKPQKKSVQQQCQEIIEEEKRKNEQARSS